MHRFWKRLAILMFFSLAILAMAEGVIRLFRLDWRYVEKNLYYNGVGVRSSILDPNPRLIYRLKPNSVYEFLKDNVPHRVTINSFGARSPERSSVKSPDVYRILCLGASNVFGADLDDSETWPVQLERWLHKLGVPQAEVWNFGTGGYIGVQMAVLGREVVPRVHSDLVLIAPSNLTSIPFLEFSRVESYFERRPEYWERLIPGASLKESSVWFQVQVWLMQRLAIYRFTRLALAELFRRDNQQFWMLSHDVFNRESAQDLGDFIHHLRRRHIRVGVVVGPFFSLPDRGSPPLLDAITSFAGIVSPTLVLRANGLPDEYSKFHPAPYVMEWYGEKIARWLLAQGFIH